MTEAALRSQLGAVSGTLRAACLTARSGNDALVLARLLGRLHWDNISGHFADDGLEQALCDRWGDAILRQALASAPALPACDLLHVATQIYDGGGHSRLLRQLVAGLDIGTQALLQTGKPATDDTGLPTSRTALRGRPMARAAQMVATGRQAGTILLHIHPDDIAAALAARLLRAEGKRVLFVNHADHVFSFGPGAADVVLDICVTGWRTTRDRRAASAQSFMGIPVVSADTPLPGSLPARDGPIVSMGGGGKFRPFPGLSFPDMLAQLLPQVPNDVVLIGPSPSDPWWADVCAAFPGRIDLRGPLPPAQVRPILQSAACYIDSFPLDGGTAFPQSVFQGPPGFGPNAQAAPGVAPTDALRFDSPSQMVEAVAAYLNGGAYPFDLADVQARILSGFSDKAVSARVQAAMGGTYSPPPEDLMAHGKRDSDYNARRWEHEGALHLPKRIWRQLSLSARLDLWRGFAAADLAAEQRALLRKRLVVG